MEHHALLSPSQFGFRHGLSTYMALLDLQTNISESINQNKFSLGVFFDISKAFDTVNHGLLINKLENIGIRVVVKNWFMDYLHNRRQYVCFKGVVYQATLITCMWSPSRLNTGTSVISIVYQRLSFYFVHLNVHPIC